MSKPLSKLRITCIFPGNAPKTNASPFNLFEKYDKCEVIGTPGHRDNLKHAYARINYNQLFIKNISQLREEKHHRSQLQ